LTFLTFNINQRTGFWILEAIRTAECRRECRGIGDDVVYWSIGRHMTQLVNVQ